MATPTEFSLDCKPNIGSHGTEKTEKLEEFVARLEQEKLKIKGFTRELPLCMQLLTNAKEASRQELQSHRMTQEDRPVLEEFMSVKSLPSSSDISADKANWMASATLWNQDFGGTQSPLVSEQQRVNGKGAFRPFTSSSEDRIPSPVLALASSSSYTQEIEDSEVCRREKSVAHKEKRKARRRWSPHLHMRFLNALHMLGGSQLATPKQIAQLMKVDGLTNDEVKSHLQKYRLHTRIQTPSPLVVVGGIWLPPEHAAAAAHGGAPAAAFYGARAATTRKVSPPSSFDYNTNMFFHAT